VIVNFQALALQPSTRDDAKYVRRQMSIAPNFSVEKVIDFSQSCPITLFLNKFAMLHAGD
jgi:hypothetical protein